MVRGDRVRRSAWRVGRWRLTTGPPAVSAPPLPRPGLALWSEQAQRRLQTQLKRQQAQHAEALAAAEATLLAARTHHEAAIAAQAEEAAAQQGAASAQSEAALTAKELIVEQLRAKQCVALCAHSD